jgi:hypothetical protein
VRREPLILSLLAATFVGLFLVGPLQVLLPEFSKSRLGLGEAERGSLMTILGVGLLAGGGLAQFLSHKMPRGLMIIAGALAAGLSMLMIPWLAAPSTRRNQSRPLGYFWRSHEHAHTRRDSAGDARCGARSRHEHLQHRVSNFGCLSGGGALGSSEADIARVCIRGRWLADHFRGRCLFAAKAVEKAEVDTPRDSHHTLNQTLTYLLDDWEPIDGLNHGLACPIL